MKRSLALALTVIIFISFVFLPVAGVFADDDDYQDHQTNLPLFVQALVSLFNVHCNIVNNSNVTYTGFQWYSNGSSLGSTSGMQALLPNNTDCIDVYWQYTLASGIAASDNIYLYRFNLYGLDNIDYIEMFERNSPWRAANILYYTYCDDYLYIMTSGNSLVPGSTVLMNLRIHIKRGGYTFSCVSTRTFFDAWTYDPDDANALTQFSEYTLWLNQFYYLGSLLREIDDLNVTVDSASVDFSNITAAIESLSNAYNNTFRYGSNYFLYEDTSDTSIKLVSVYETNSDFTTVIDTTFLYSDSNVSSSGELQNFIIGINLDMPNNVNYPYLSIRIPLNDYIEFSNLSVYYTYGPAGLNNSQILNLDFDHMYSNFCYVRVQNTDNTYPDFLIDIYTPLYNYDLNSSDNMIYLKFSSDEPWIDINYNIDYDVSSFYAWGRSSSNINAAISLSNHLLERIYILLQSIGLNIGADTSTPDYPSGPADPGDTTNIYNVDVDLNSSIGDITLFEGDYGSMFDTQSQLIDPSAYSFGGAGISETFTSMNGVFSGIVNDSLSTETDEHTGITYYISCIGLYFITPLILFIIMAFFRRTTA